MLADVCFSCRFSAELPLVHTGQHPQDLPHIAQAGKYPFHHLLHAHLHQRKTILEAAGFRTSCGICDSIICRYYFISVPDVGLGQLAILDEYGKTMIKGTA